MGKGDLRSRRGKLYRGTHGNTRPKAARVRTKRKAAKKAARQQQHQPAPGPGPQG
jgi:ribosomal small subunit protein bTHX